MMTDDRTKRERSENMAAIRSTNTAPEVYFRKLLFARGYRYSLYNKHLPGKPDLFLRKYNTAIFINGCFWHHHSGCHYAYMPKSNMNYWQKKIRGNVERDKKVKDQLKDKRIRQLVVWECTIKKMKKSSEYAVEILDKTTDFLNSDIQYKEL